MSRLQTLLIISLCLLFTGCETPVFEHPLSNETTSAIDERLIGQWDLMVPEPQTPGGLITPQRYVIGKTAGKPNVHEIAILELDADKQPAVHRAPAWCVQLGPERYISLLVNDRDPNAKPLYSMLQYEHVGDSVHFYSLDKERIVQAIERGELAGVVRRQPPPENASPNPNAAPSYREIRVTADAEALRNFFRQHGKTLFERESHFTLRRVAGP